MFYNWVLMYNTALSNFFYQFQYLLWLGSPNEVFASLKQEEEEIKIKSTRNRSAQSNKSDSVDGVFQVNEASKMAGNITNNGSTNTDHGNRNDEARVTSTQSYIYVKKSKKMQLIYLYGINVSFVKKWKIISW